MQPQPETAARTEAQAAASRANGAQSQGPHDTSRTRYNNLQHGLYAKSVIFSTGQAAELESKVEAYTLIYQPANQHELDAVRRLATAEYQYFLALGREEDLITITTAATRAKFDSEFRNGGWHDRIAYAEKSIHDAGATLEKFRRNLGRLRRESESALRQLDFMQRRRARGCSDMGIFQSEPEPQPEESSAAA